jgi:hypothetical protein
MSTIKHGSVVDSSLSRCFPIDTVDMRRPTQRLAIAHQGLFGVFVLKDAKLEPCPSFIAVFVHNLAFGARLGDKLKTYGMVNELGYERLRLEPELRNEVGTGGADNHWIVRIGEADGIRHGGQL